MDRPPVFGNSSHNLVEPFLPNPSRMLLHDRVALNMPTTKSPNDAHGTRITGLHCYREGIGATAMKHQLAGKRILIIEDEPMIAENLAFEINAEGAKVIGPVATEDAALEAIANGDLDGATLDIKLMDKKSFQVADVLAACHIPFVFLTGYDAGAVPARYSNVPRCEKPVTPAAVCRTLETVLSLPRLDKLRPS